MLFTNTGLKEGDQSNSNSWRWCQILYVLWQSNKDLNQEVVNYDETMRNVTVRILISKS